MHDGQISKQRAKMAGIRIPVNCRETPRDGHPAWWASRECAAAMCAATKALGHSEPERICATGCWWSNRTRALLALVGSLLGACRNQPSVEPVAVGEPPPTTESPSQPPASVLASPSSTEPGHPPSVMTRALPSSDCRGTRATHHHHCSTGVSPPGVAGVGREGGLAAEASGGLVRAACERVFTGARGSGASVRTAAADGSADGAISAWAELDGLEGRAAMASGSGMLVAATDGAGDSARGRCVT